LAYLLVPNIGYMTETIIWFLFLFPLFHITLWMKKMQLEKQIKYIFLITPFI